MLKTIKKICFPIMNPGEQRPPLLLGGMTFRHLTNTLEFQRDLIALRKKAVAGGMSERCIAEIDLTFAESIAAMRACGIVRTVEEKAAL